MALPSGYTKLDYIESSGTQYINTGFKPNQNTHVVMDVEVLGTTQCAPFGARVSQSGTTYTLFLMTATTGRTDYGTSKQTMTFSSILGRYTIDANKNVVNVNGVSITHTASTFSVDHNIFLLAVNTAGKASNFAKVKLYSCKIYDNGTLVRDFIPCKNASGTIGLWDNVNSVFYANAGTGTFSTGTKPKTLIDGTGYEIKSGRVLIAGTGYGIKKGRTLIDGTGYDISFGTPVGELAVGTSVFMNVNGVRTEFIVVHQGNPDATIYDASCNGTWVLAKNIYGVHIWDNTDNDYKNSEIHAYLNNTFLGLLDSNIQRKIRQVKIPYVNGDGYTDNDVSTGANGLSAKIFLLSYYEVGFNNSPSSLQWVDGAKLDYFLSGTGTSANKRRVAYYNGSAKTWAIRSPNRFSSTDIYSPNSDGDWYLGGVTLKYGIRPAWVLPFDDAKFDDNFNIF